MPRPAGGYDVEHTSQVYLVDRQGRLRATFQGAGSEEIASSRAPSCRRQSDVAVRLESWIARSRACDGSGARLRWARPHSPASRRTRRQHRRRLAVADREQLAAHRGARRADTGRARPDLRHDGDRHADRLLRLRRLGSAAGPHCRAHDARQPDARPTSSAVRRSSCRRAAASSSPAATTGPAPARPTPATTTATSSVRPAIRSRAATT